MKLYGARESSCTRRVVLAFALKHISYEFVAVDVYANEHCCLAFRDINPQAKIPVLEVDGTYLTQSLAICEYIDEIRKEPPLLPPEPRRRALCRAMIETINADIQPMQNKGTLDYIASRFQDRVDSSEFLSWPAHWIERGLGALEELVKQSGGAYCMGDQITLADVFLVPQLLSARQFGVRVEHYRRLVGIEAEVNRVLPVAELIAGSK